jgi:uncharacterized delta-60 repeat protein
MVTTSRYLTFAALVALSLALFVPGAGARPDDLDPTYGVGGLAISGSATDTNSGGPYGGFAMAPDGSTIVGSNQPGATNADLDKLTVTRITPAGTLDTGFGPSAEWSAFFGGTYAALKAVTLTPNGSVFGAGYSDSYLAGFYRNGAQNGFYINPNNCSAVAATSQANNEPVAVGSCGDFPVVARYKAVPGPGFNLDTTFNGTGTAPASTSKGAFNGATVDASGRIVAVGVRDYGSGDDDFFVVRYLSNGLLDPSFHDEANLDGRVSEPIGEHNDTAKAVAIQADGKIVVAGYGNNLMTSASLAEVARFNTDGSIDTSFGVGGKLVFKFGPSDSPFTSVAVQPNGKIVLVGSRYDDAKSNNDSLIVRLLSNGSFDESFAPGGKIVGVPGYAESEATGVGLLPDGKILVGELLTIAGKKIPSVLRLAGGEVPAPVALSSTITSPNKSKYKAKKLKKFAGTATGDGLAKVQVALLKPDSKLLKKKKRCYQLTGNKAKFKKYKAVKKKCVPVKWLNATGTTSWSYKLKKTLKPGKYTLYVRSLNTSGVAQNALTKKSFKLTK